MTITGHQDLAGDTTTALAHPVSVDVLAPGQTYSTVTDKISSIVLTRKAPRFWYVGVTIGFLGTMVLLYTISYLLIRGVGIWGYKVFDSDNACAFLGDVIKHLAAVVEDGLELGRSKRRRKFRAALARGDTLSLDGPVVPAVAAIRALLAGIDAARVCVAKEQVRRWMEAYFEWYEREYVPINGPNRRYRNNVQKEFDELLRLAWREDPEVYNGG